MFLCVEMMPLSRKAYSLIETLVVIAILAILLSLLLPAIQRIRETDNAMTCRLHLRQIGFAAHNYESTFGHLPPGYIGPVPDTNTRKPSQMTGHLPMLLPGSVLAPR